MKAEDSITGSTLYRLKEGNSEVFLEKGREEDRTYQLVASDSFMHLSIERQRRFLDEMRGKWIAHIMEMIAKETKEKLLGMGVEYRVDMQAVEKMPATESPGEVNLKEMLGWECWYAK